MNDYDEFQDLMQQAGWSLDEIEAMWQDFVPLGNEEHLYADPEATLPHGGQS